MFFTCPSNLGFSFTEIHPNHHIQLMQRNRSVGLDTRSSATISADFRWQTLCKDQGRICAMANSSLFHGSSSRSMRGTESRRVRRGEGIPMTSSVRCRLERVLQCRPITGRCGRVQSEGVREGMLQHPCRRRCAWLQLPFQTPTVERMYSVRIRISVRSSSYFDS